MKRKMAIRLLPLAGLLLAVTVFSDVAEARPDTRQMSCAAVRQLVASSGAIVLTTGRFTYDRIVAGQGFCGGDEETAIKRAPTLDNPNCPIGFYCRPASIFRDPPLIFRN